MNGKFARGVPWIVTAALLSLAVVGCSGSSGSTSEAVGRGSPACQSWQTSLCNYVSQCGSASGDAATCEAQAGGVICKSDSAATACATQLNTATCADPPANCDLTDMADPTAAVAPCQSYLGAVCDAEVRCSLQSDKAGCLAKAQTEVDCSTIYSVSLSYETCLDDLASVSCTSLKTALPTSFEPVSIPSCMGLLYSGTGTQD